MFRFLPYLKKYRIYVILGPIFKLIEAVFELIVPIVTSLIIDKGVRQGDLTYVWHMGGVLIGLGAVGLGSALICQKFASIASLGFGTAVRNQMYEKINTFSHAEIDRFGTPSLITRITNDVNQLQQAAAHSFGHQSTIFGNRRCHCRHVNRLEIGADFAGGNACHCADFVHGHVSFRTVL